MGHCTNTVVANWPNLLFAQSTCMMRANKRIQRAKQHELADNNHTTLLPAATTKQGSGRMIIATRQMAEHAQSAPRLIVARNAAYKTNSNRTKEVGPGARQDPCDGCPPTRFMLHVALVYTACGSDITYMSQL